jgi:hypothetical protein
MALFELTKKSESSPWNLIASTIAWPESRSLLSSEHLTSTKNIKWIKSYCFQNHVHLVRSYYENTNAKRQITVWYQVPIKQKWMLLYHWKHFHWFLWYVITLFHLPYLVVKNINVFIAKKCDFDEAIFISSSSSLFEKYWKLPE